MANVRLEINASELAKLQRAVNAKAQDILRQVNDAMAGSPVDEIMQALRKLLIDNGLEPNEDILKSYAQAISDGTLTE